jgi:hypothetical protein
MFAIQHRLPLVPVRTRRARRPFHPSQDHGAYRLPHDVRDRLTAALAPFKNRQAAFALAVFVARFWSMPSRLAGSFPIDRRALANHAELGLSEARVRGALRTLEAIGYLDRALTSGSPYQRTADGPHRKPIVYQFGADYRPGFAAANRRAAMLRVVPKPPNSPINRSVAKPQVIMGEKNPSASAPYAPLEAALERLRRAAEGQGRVRAASERDS